MIFLKKILLTEKHDGFPAYEFIITQSGEEIIKYGYNPREDNQSLKIYCILGRIELTKHLIGA